MLSHFVTLPFCVHECKELVAWFIVKTGDADTILKDAA